MSLSNYLSFFILVAAVVFSPGPMTIFMMINGMNMQYKNVWPILLGANNGYFLSIILFAFLLAKLLQVNHDFLRFIQILGASYLLYLAYSQWRKKLSLDTVPLRLFQKKDLCALYLRGLLIALTNPKTILLFALVFPQFINSESNEFLQMLLLAATFLMLQFMSGCVYAYSGRYIKMMAANWVGEQFINKISSIVLGVIAIFLFLSY